MVIDVIVDLIGGFLPATLFSRLLFKFLKIENKNKKAIIVCLISLFLCLGITRLTGMAIITVFSAYFPWLIVWLIRDLLKKDKTINKETPVSN